jgi:phage tail sheath protein FI
VQADAVNHCELMGDRMMILDPPISASRTDQFGIGAIRAWRQRFDSTYAALYYPWTRVVDPLRGSTGITRDIPPSGHVAGQYANADFAVGVHKAPANDALNWVQDVTAAVNATTHGILNSLGINAIRALAGRGIRIMGARTVSSNPVWRFVNVRRLMMMIEKALRLSTQWAVFEPNNVSTRAKIRLSIASFLISLWQQGALMGDTADQALRVRCDDTNNTETDIQNGRLTADVLVAPSNPFEFIVVRVGRVSNQFELQELGSIVEVH